MESHGEELLAGVAVLCERGIVDGVEDEGVAVVDPHGVWIGVEEEAIVLAGGARGYDFLFKQDKDHAEGDKVLGNVPELGADAG
jgi:hypothetical protein